jgi:tetratricopeptide (TPR) repeat protein
MSESSHDSLDQGWTAFLRRDWSDAIRLFTTATSARTPPSRQAEAAFALAHAHAQLADAPAVVAALADALTLAADLQQFQATVQAWQPCATFGYAINAMAVGFAQVSPGGLAQRVEQLRRLALIYESAGDSSGALLAYGALQAIAPLDATQNQKAAKYFKRALEADPNSVAAMDGLAATLWIEGDVTQAQQVFARRAASSADPIERAAAQFKAAIVQPAIPWDDQEIDAARARFAEALAAGPSVAFPDPWKLGLGPNVYAHYHARLDRSLHEAAARYFLAATPSLAETRLSSRSQRARRRVGMVSSYFSGHVVGYLNFGLITKLDRNRFDLVLFRTPGARFDATTHAMATAARIVDLPADLPAARRIIAEAELDVLHYPEIGMDTFTYFLAFARLAPLQTVSWGHPATSGLPNIDLFLSPDAMEPPDADQHYSERLIRLRSLSIDVARPVLESESMTRDRLGLSPSRPAYVCAQSLFKAHHTFDETVRLILSRDRDGMVYFISHSDYADRRFLDRLRRTVGDDMVRVKILPRFTKTTFLHLLRASDVLLDVPQWSGGKSSLEGLAMGTPIVHHPGQFMRGRHTRAFLHHIGLAATVVDAPSVYAEVAARLVHDSAFRREVREHIARNSERLFGDVASVREIEDVWTSALASQGRD